MNVLEYAQIFSAELDRQMVDGASSGWMERNAGNVKYTGGSEVKVPQISMDGLGDYDRGSGYPEGSVTLSYKTLTMEMDRGRTFLLDAMDVDETNFVASAAGVMGEFQATKVIPEVDAYRYSKIAALAAAAGQALAGTVPTAASILTLLRADMYKIWDSVGDSVPLVISMSTAAAQLLDGSAEIQRMLGVADFARGSVSTKVKTLDDAPILKVPSARMMTKYVFADGTSADQTGGGFGPATDAVPINWIITGARTPIAVSKADVTRVFDPLTTQRANAWQMDYRRYHDLWIMPNKIKGVWVNTQ